MLHVTFRTGLTALVLTTTLAGCTPSSQSAPETASYTQQPAVASVEPADRNLPSLIVTDEPPPEVIYRRGSRDIRLNESDDIGRTITLPSFNTEHIETPITRKATELKKDLEKLRSETEESQDRLTDLQAQNDTAAAEYYALMASINTDLQSGTTPGNPVLLSRWNIAQEKLDALSQRAESLNGLATDVATHASHATYLLESTQNAFAVSGAVKEDHQKLRTIEDGIEEDIAATNRLMKQVNDEISRRTSYLRAERANMQTLALGISKGELYGQNLTNSLFKKATEEGLTTFKPSSSGSSAAPTAAPGSRRPLVIIRFDRPNISYDQPLYAAISQALDKYPSARFDLVAVSNLEGNAAQLALAAAEARKNGEMVLRSLNQMGLPLERVHLSAASSKDVLNSEVHIYLQ